jgi:hypothetical protein
VMDVKDEGAHLTKIASIQKAALSRAVERKEKSESGSEVNAVGFWPDDLWAFCGIFYGFHFPRCGKELMRLNVELVKSLRTKP